MESVRPSSRAVLDQLCLLVSCYIVLKNNNMAHSDQMSVPREGATVREQIVYEIVPLRVRVSVNSPGAG